MLNEIEFPVVDLASSATSRLEIEISVDVSEPYLGDEGSAEEIHDAAENAWNTAIARGQHIFNRPGDPPNLVRAVGLKRRENKVTVGVQPTWFWTFLGTNRQLRAGNWPGHEHLLEAERADPLDLPSSKLANCLSVNLAIISADDPPRVLIQQRGKTAGLALVPYQCSAAGFMDFADTKRQASAVASHAARREAFEETGFNLADCEIDWLSVARDKWSLMVGLAGVCRMLDRSADLTPRATQDEFEVEGYEWWTFTPEAILRKWKELGSWYRVVPLGGWAILCALASTYGEDSLIAAYEAIGGIPGLPNV